MFLIVVENRLYDLKRTGIEFVKNGLDRLQIVGMYLEPDATQGYGIHGRDRCGGLVLEKISYAGLFQPVF